MSRVRPILVAAAVLAVFALPAAAHAALPEIPSSHFEQYTECGCHSGFQLQWERSMHAQAITDPIYLYELELGQRDTDGQIAAFCNSCHTPVSVMAGEIEGLDHSRMSAVGLEGVTCDFCHQITGGDSPPGNYSMRLDSPDGTKRAQFDDAVSPAHETAYSEFHTKAEFCGSCHDVFHPGNGLQLEGTYTEWLNGPYAAEGIVCQDCHMTPGPGPTKPYAGKAASFGPEREHIYIMTFAGGNTALGMADLAEERLKAAAEIEVETPEYVPVGESGEVNVTITNVGAGHYLPTGLTNVRQMWLEVTATDHNGGVVMSERHDFGTEFADEEGNHPVEVWQAVSVARDDRIPPQQSVSYDYELTMPEGGVAEVRAALYYRSCSEEIAEKAGVNVERTTMATSGKIVYASARDAADAAREVMDENVTGQPEGINVLWFVAISMVLAIGVTGWAMRHNSKLSKLHDQESSGPGEGGDAG
jgi:hypothetical protein